MVLMYGSIFSTLFLFTQLLFSISWRSKRRDKIINNLLSV